MHTVALNGKELTMAHLIRKQVQQILVTDPTCQGEKLVTSHNSMCQSFEAAIFTSHMEHGLNLRIYKALSNTYFRNKPRKVSFDGLSIQWGSASTRKTTYIILRRLVFNGQKQGLWHLKDNSLVSLPSTVQQKSKRCEE